MKMEAVKAELDRWGEVMIRTDGGDRFEIHLGDAEFDFESRTIRLRTSNAIFVIDGDKVESVEMHYGHHEGSED